MVITGDGKALIEFGNGSTSMHTAVDNIGKTAIISLESVPEGDIGRRLEAVNMQDAMKDADLILRFSNKESLKFVAEHLTKLLDEME